MNLFFIGITIIRQKIKEWNETDAHARPDFGKSRWIRAMNRRLIQAEKRFRREALRKEAASLRLL